MIKSFCDWCKSEFQRGMVENKYRYSYPLTAESDRHKLSLIIAFEFPPHAEVPSEICEACIAKTLLSAAERMGGSE